MSSRLTKTEIRERQSSGAREAQIRRWQRRGWRDFLAVEQEVGGWDSASHEDVVEAMLRLDGKLSPERMVWVVWAAKTYAEQTDILDPETGETAITADQVREALIRNFTPTPLKLKAE